jgi:hypothetical protein
VSDKSPDPMPWCEWCQSYHGPKARHLRGEEPIPKGYVWAGGETGFICPAAGGPVPYGFDEKWLSRKDEFPTFESWVNDRVKEYAEAESEKAADQLGQTHARTPEEVAGRMSGRIKGARVITMSFERGLAEPFLKELADGKALRMVSDGVAYICAEAKWRRSGAVDLTFTEIERDGE